MQLKPRPTGVILLAILAVLAGIFSLAFGVLLAATDTPASVLLLANGIVDFVLALGYQGGSGWAWVLGIVFGTINIAGSIIEIVAGLSNNILGIIFSIITIYYLTRPHVRIFFGRGPAMAVVALPTPAGPPTLTGSSSTMLPMSMRCRNCGASLSAGAIFCQACGTFQ